MTCWCGRSCDGAPSSTDPRIRSERDVVARWLVFHPGEQMPVLREVTERQSERGMAPPVAAVIATLSEWDAVAPFADEMTKARPWER